jgi:DNA mismatch repair protein MutL
MPTRILDPSVAAKIAAGEVVERPASVVKELVDNCLDSGATRIGVQIKGGGINQIKVVDNGIGIASDEVEIVFARHATSKVVTADDLTEIKTLGFRGEALPSIAAVARVSLETHYETEPVGTKIVIDNGDVIEKRQFGCPKGTVVLVENLFRKVPARLKFLKSTQAENGRISNIVSQYCLAYPEVKFSLVMEEKDVLNSPGSGNAMDAVTAVYGLDVADGLMEIASNNGSIEIFGYTSKPSLSRSNRNYISIFVNRRWVKSQALAYALEEAYHGLLVAGRHPISIVNIILPYSEVDVNVHPAKTEVRFSDERAVFAAVQKLARGTLVGSISVPEVGRRLSSQQSIPFTHVAHPVVTEGQVASTPSVSSVNDLEVNGESPLPILRVVGQITNTYIVAEGPDGAYLIDQHAAHERILYEKVLSEREQRTVGVQSLLELITMELSPNQEVLLKSRSEYLYSYGFNIEPFGDRTYVIRAVPALIAGKNVVESVLAVIDSLDDTVADWKDGIAVSLACHGAIKAGQLLGAEEMREIVGQLEKAAQPYNCPHGRPTMIHITTAQLEKEFKRR